MKLFALLVLPLLTLSAVVLTAQDAPAPEKKAETKESEKKEGEDTTQEEKEKPEAEAEPDKATLDKLAPSFTLKNADGKDVKLADFKDKIVVIEWINLDCPWCKAHYEEGDALVKMQKELREDDVVWLTICSSGEGKQGNFDADTLKKRIEAVELKTEFYLIDADGAVGKKYEAQTTPHCYVIDKEGKLRYRGALDNLRERRKNIDLEEVNYVKLAIDALKDDKKIDTTDTKPYG
jgi:peroxiredoxin